jgi:NADH-quinone oxidoreductase subunit J
MRHLLFMQIDAPAERGFLPFVTVYWPILLPAILGFLAIYLLLPRARGAWPLWGGLCASAALIVAGAWLLHAASFWEETVLFYIFAFLAVLAGGLMITQSNPVYAALSFALVVLSTCGLFLLQAAPFLMAATIIIYAGAIVVTFLFVIMLAQQTGHDSADLRSREPFLGTAAGIILTAATLCTVQRAMATPDLDRVIARLESVASAATLDDANQILGTPPAKEVPGGRTLPVVEEARSYFPLGDEVSADKAALIESSWNKRQLEPLKKNAQDVAARLKVLRQRQGSLAQDDVPGKPHLQPGTLPHRNVEGLGRLLFTDYLVPVELAGVLLLVATIGAIVIAGRHTEVLR